MSLKQDKTKKHATLRANKIKDAIFFACIAALPLAMLFLNDIYINLNSIVLAFQEYDEYGAAHFAGLDNFKQVAWDFFNNENMVVALKNSVIIYLTTTIITLTVPKLFTFYIFKKMPGSNFFKVVLFLPSILSGLTIVMIYKFMADRVVPDILTQWGFQVSGLLSNPDTAFGTLLFYSIWMGLGGGMVVGLGAMNATEKSVLEASYLDGTSFFQEFWHIVLPSSYKVLSLSFITGIVGIFTNQFNLYAFFGENASGYLRTLGYYFYVKTLGAKEVAYPYLAAWGVFVSIVVVPVTLLARKLIYKYGPSEE